jgi:uncharacterized membrane protein YuzA (DUF378 family)
MEIGMKALNVVTLILLIVGGLNWGLVGLFSFDLVAALFGAGSVLSRLVYVLVGVSALWQLVPLVRSFGADEPAALRGSSTY